jgi:hypothetical protein
MARAVMPKAVRKVSVGTISTSRTSTCDSGGMRIVIWAWPTASHIAAQNSSENALGMRYPRMSIGYST